MVRLSEEASVSKIFPLDNFDMLPSIESVCGEAIDGLVYIMHYNPTSSVSTTDPDTTAGSDPTSTTVTYTTDDGSFLFVLSGRTSGLFMQISIRDGMTGPEGFVSVGVVRFKNCPKFYQNSWCSRSSRSLQMFSNTLLIPPPRNQNSSSFVPSQ
jgi:hypothetical protein